MPCPCRLPSPNSPTKRSPANFDDPTTMNVPLQLYQSDTSSALITALGLPSYIGKSDPLTSPLPSSTARVRQSVTVSVLIEMSLVDSLCVGRLRRHAGPIRPKQRFFFKPIWYVFNFKSFSIVRIIVKIKLR